MLLFIVPDVTGLIVKFKVSIESQPNEFIKVSKYTPVDDLRIPLNRYG